MNWLIDKVGLFNRWFDDQREPSRFLLFITVMALTVCTLQFGITFGSAAMAFIGAALFGVMSFIATLRAVGLGGKHRTIAKGIIGVYMLLLVIVVLRFFF